MPDCAEAGQAILIDPVIVAVERDLAELGRLGLRLAFTVETHIHADHITAALQLKRRAGSRIAAPACDRVFTGDALLIGGCGRTDFQDGDADALYKSVREKLFALADEVLVYPAHDYQRRRVSSTGQATPCRSPKNDRTAMMMTIRPTM